MEKVYGLVRLQKCLLHSIEAGSESYGSWWLSACLSHWPMKRESRWVQKEGMAPFSYVPFFFFIIFPSSPSLPFQSKPIAESRLDLASCTCPCLPLRLDPFPHKHFTTSLYPNTSSLFNSIFQTQPYVYIYLTFADMPVTQTRYQAPTYSRPVAMPGKPASKLPVAYPAPYGRVAISPPQRGSSANTSAVPSLTSDSGSNSSEYGDGASSGIDLVELLNDKLSTTVSPMPLDRSLARQAQT